MTAFTPGGDLLYQPLDPAGGQVKGFSFKEKVELIAQVTQLGLAQISHPTVVGEQDQSGVVELHQGHHDKLVGLGAFAGFG